eukprot:TRINITY_DN15270_c0_g1_i1.p1 TRINITY_DN15270_c0_g1~~TRINITY_DN15270_c0_g1_i1.p1  ORF type:complete len:158 (+),score=9.15 TRINITY_DN15270_c0_g1_i1:66-539(+)
MCYWVCEICLVSTNSESHKDQHRGSKNHASRVYWTCEICDVDCKNSSQKGRHFRSSEHNANIKPEKSERRPTSRIEHHAVKSEPSFQEYVSRDRINGLSLKELQTLESELTRAQERVKDAISAKYRTHHDCVVCSESSRDTLLMPCKHFVMCNSWAS